MRIHAHINAQTYLADHRSYSLQRQHVRSHKHTDTYAENHTFKDKIYIVMLSSNENKCLDFRIESSIKIFIETLKVLKSNIKSYKIK